MNFSRCHQKQTGFTLIELLVGVSISLLVAFIAITYLVSSARLLTVQNNTDLIQENGRFAFEFMSSDFRHAGLNQGAGEFAKKNTAGLGGLIVEGITTKSICTSDLNIEPPTTIGATLCNTSLNYTINGQSVNTDRIAFDYVTDRGATCTGIDIVEQIGVVSVYWVADIDGDGISSLYCQAYTAPFNTNTGRYTDYSVAGTASALVDGIESIQIQYGIDTDNDDNNDIEKYSIFSEVQTGNNIGDVRSAKIGFLISSGEAIPREQNTEDTVNGAVRTYTVLGQTFGFPSTDRVERKTLSTTVFFPNLPSRVL